MHAKHYKVRQDGHIRNKAAYIVLGIDLEGKKDILGIWIGENESAKFSLSILNDLKPIYKAFTEEAGLLKLKRFEEKKMAYSN